MAEIEQRLAIEQPPRVRRARGWLVPGIAGSVGGVLLAINSLLFGPLTSGETVLGLGQELLWLYPIGLLLVWLSLHRLHRLHRGRTNRLETLGFHAAATGLCLVTTFALISGVDFANRSPGAALGWFLGVLALRVGLLTFALGVQRAGVLPRTPRVVVLASGTALGLAFLAAFARIESVQTTLSAVGWALWSVFCGLALLDRDLAALPEADARTVPFREVRGAFLSRATLVSALVSVAVLTLEWEWYVGALVVLLLYAHELGHVIAAIMRGVKVQRAPFFVPGLGAFVQTAPGASHWDDVWVSLGGPLIGGTCALAVKSVGVVQGNAAFAQAGEVGLWLNVLNLAPFSPLDGGRVANRTGWFGLAITLLAGVFLVTQGLDAILLLLVGFGVWQAFVAVRTTRIAWRTQIGVLAVYLGSAVLLLLAAVGSGPATWTRAPRPDWLPGLSDVFSLMFWLFIVGAFAVPFAMADGRGAILRYGVLATFGWMRHILDGRQWIIPVEWALAGEALGLGGISRVERTIARLARQQDARAGEAMALGYDCLRRRGRDADAWLTRMAPDLAVGGPDVLTTAFVELLRLGYGPPALALFDLCLADGQLAADLPAAIANTYAWHLFGAGRAADALPYAEAAVAATPEDASSLDTLGQVLVALDQPAAGEAHLRRALALRDRSGTRYALARALAGQGQLAAAAAEAETALRTPVGVWYPEEPSPADAQRHIGEWQRAAAAVP